ncbi:MAG: DUF1015 domain-containing protein [Ignavibacteriae bacterium]|nr:DUF1015 domain-containing protein [Ignavibacteriota bacterium]
MADIKAFRGYLYNQSKVNIQEVVAPPYDVISPEQQERLYEVSRYNIVRLILGKEADRYASAAKHFADWQQEHVLARDSAPALYVVHQRFTDKDGKEVIRKGFIALCKLVEFEKRVVLPHEKTMAKPREDRLKLFKATNANFSQVFSLYSDPGKEVDSLLNGIAKSEPAVNVLYEDVENSVWRLTDAKVQKAVQEFLSGKQVLIADGHHRYETALAYRDFMRQSNPQHTGNELYNYMMMFFTNIDDEGLVIYPTHRLVHSLRDFKGEDFLARLEEHFIVRDVKDYESLSEGMKSSSVPAFGLIVSGFPMYYLITLKPTPTLQEIIKEEIPSEVKELDVTVLHTLIIKNLLGISAEAQEQKTNLDYVKDARHAIEAVESGSMQLAFLMNPTKIEQVRAVAKAGHTMPQKSTYFFPKLLSGLVINKLEA